MSVMITLEQTGWAHYWVDNQRTIEELSAMVDQLGFHYIKKELMAELLGSGYK